ncbi:MAG: DUF1080 domain-containing protein [Ardenticatenaceae bacterium]|nr:DUF1080 domain-containing protein [Ardenticatenaceae bacterium]
MTGQEINHSANNWKGWIWGSRTRIIAFYALNVLLLVIITFAVAFLIFKPKSSPVVETSTSGQILAWDIAQLVQTSSSSQQSNGLYAPDKGIFLYTLLAAGQNNAQISWAAAQLTPLAGRFAGLAQDEMLYWYITSADSGSQTLIAVPFNRVGDAAYYESFQAPNQAMTASVPVNTEVQAPETPVETVAEVVVETAVTDTPETVTTTDIQNVTAAFDVNAEGWAPMSGDWIAEEGLYRQKDAGGFDYITMLLTGPLTNYTAEVDFLIHTFEMGPGFVYHLPNPDNRAQGHLIDITDNGTAVRFAHYNEAGDFQYDGGAQITPSLELETWHTLRLEVNGTTTVFYLDGAEIGRRDNTRTDGYMGLVTSLAAVDFDNFRLTQGDATAVTNQFEQPVVVAAPDTVETVVVNDTAVVEVPQPEPETTEAAVPQPSQLTRVFAANFDDGAVGWSPLSGTWIDENGVYAQSDAETETAVAMIGSGVVENFIAEMRFRGPAESGGAGLLFHVPQNDNPAGALAVRLSANGQLLQWGRFDEENAFTVEAETAVPTPINDENWHRMRLVVFGSQAVLYIDGQETAVHESNQSAGYIGLVTSGAGMQFDEFSVEQLPIQFTLSPGLSLPINDDFEDGNADGWQTNGGTWEIIANEYHQTAIGQFDLVAAGPFQGNNYDITSRFRLVEGNLAAGFAFNMAARDSLAHSQIVSLTQQGTALQWGHFDGNGTRIASKKMLPKKGSLNHKKCYLRNHDGCENESTQ